MNQCSYLNSNQQRCPHKAMKAGVSNADRNYCIFHSKGMRSKNELKRFEAKFRKLVRKKDGNWQGFVFPIDIVLENERINFPIDILDATFTRDVSLKQVTFEHQVTSNNARFSNTLSLMNCSFENTILANNTTYEKDLKINSINIQKDLLLSSSTFKDMVIISGEIIGRAHFNNCTFKESARFHQTANFNCQIKDGLTLSLSGSHIDIIHVHGNANFWQKLKILHAKYKNILISRIRHIKKSFSNGIQKVIRKSKGWFTKKRVQFPHVTQDKFYLLFYGEANFCNVLFEKPNSITFSGVDLRRAYFSGTNLKGINFEGNLFYQAVLKRNGLADEVRVLNINNYYDKKRALPVLETLCREMRTSLEDIKDFQAANDFYIGEMEAKRYQYPILKKRFFSILALYKYFCQYGTSPIRVIMWLHALIITHALLIAYIVGFDSITSVKSCLDYLLYSFQTITLQKDKLDIIPENFTSSYLPHINSLFSVGGLVFGALLAVSLRMKTKRN